MLPLTDLATADENKGLSSSVDLKSKIDRALPNFQEDAAGGTGPLAQYIPGFFRTSQGREQVADVENVRALYQQMISGKVISEQEAKRLQAFLPTAGKTETQNREDLQRLRDGIELNLQLFERAKREGLTANEAYEKYGKDIISGQSGRPTTDSTAQQQVAQQPTTQPQQPSPGNGVDMLQALLSGGLKSDQNTPQAQQPVQQSQQPQQPQDNRLVGGAVGNVLDFILPRTQPAIQESVKRQQQRDQQPQSLMDVLNPVKQVGNFYNDVIKPVAPAGAEAASYLLPLERLGLIKGGAVAGGLLGATDPGDLSLEERAKKAAEGAIGGAATGGMLKGAGKIAEGVSGQAENFVNQLFKPAQSDLEKLRKYGNMEFANEVIKRDLPAIQGKSAGQILQYYTGKVDALDNAANSFLEQKGGAIEKKSLIDIAQGLLSGRDNRVMQGPARSNLQQLLSDLERQPDQLPLTVANQIKRDIQTAAKAAYNADSPTPGSKAMEEAAAKINDLIESKAPGIKDVNRSIMFYRTAQDSLQSTLDRASKSEGGGLIQQLLIGAGGGGAVASMMSGNPLYGLASSAPALAYYLQKQPQVKTRMAAGANAVGQAALPDVIKRLLLLGGAKAGAAF